MRFLYLSIFFFAISHISIAQETPKDINDAQWGNSIAINMIRRTGDLANPQKIGEDSNGTDIKKSYPSRQYTITVDGQTYVARSLTMEGYANLFRDTGGPTISQYGINLKFAMGFNTNASGGSQTFTNMAFLAYNAFLCLMVGFYWFGIMGEVSKGKGGLEIIPFLGKLAVGLVVSYNLPFVYSMAMTLKDLGQQVVLESMNNSPGLARAVQAVDGSQQITSSQRESIIRQALAECINNYLLPISETIPLTPASGATTVSQTDILNQARNDGRTRLALLIALLNNNIDDLMGGAYDTGTGTPTKSSSLLVVNTQKISFSLSRGNYTLNDKFPPLIGGGNGSVDLVGFTPGTPELILAGNTLTLTRNQVKDGGGVTDSGVPTDGNSSSGVVGLLLNTMVKDTRSARAASEQYSAAYTKYLLTASRTFSRNKAVEGLAALGSPIFIGTNKDAQPTGQYLGDQLLAADKAYNKTKNLKNYQDSVSAIIKNYVQESIDFGNNMSGTRPAGAPSDGWGSWIFDNIGGLVTGFIKAISDLFLWLVSYLWVPFLAYLATTIFNFTIEAYVFLLWLAYPFWFYKKTEKSFTGALNTLIATCFTSATFIILITLFEGFHGSFLNSIVGPVALGGASAAGAATAITAGLVAPTLFAAGVVAVAGFFIGYCLIYIIGTAICLKLAPAIFKAFLEGSSVVTPMVMGALTSAAAGVVAGGLAAGGLGRTAGGALAKSKTIAAAGRAIASAPRSALGSMQKAMGSAQSKLGGDGSALTQAGNRNLNAMSKYREGPDGKGLFASMGADAKGIGSALSVKSIASGIKNLVQNPGGLLKSLATSNVGKIAIVAGTAMSGDLGKTLTNVGQYAFAEETLKRLGNNQISTASVSGRTEDTSAPPNIVGASTGANGGTTAATTAQRNKLPNEAQAKSPFEQNRSSRSGKDPYDLR